MTDQIKHRKHSSARATHMASRARRASRQVGRPARARKEATTINVTDEQEPAEKQVINVVPQNDEREDRVSRRMTHPARRTFRGQRSTRGTRPANRQLRPESQRNHKIDINSESAVSRMPGVKRLSETEIMDENGDISDILVTRDGMNQMHLAEVALEQVYSKPDNNKAEEHKKDSSSNKAQAPTTAKSKLKSNQPARPIGIFVENVPDEANEPRESSFAKANGSTLTDANGDGREEHLQLGQKLDKAESQTHSPKIFKERRSISRWLIVAGLLNIILAIIVRALPPVMYTQEIPRYWGLAFIMPLVAGICLLYGSIKLETATVRASIATRVALALILVELIWSVTFPSKLLTTLAFMTSAFNIMAWLAFSWRFGKDGQKVGDGPRWLFAIDAILTVVTIFLILAGIYAIFALATGSVGSDASSSGSTSVMSSGRLLICVVTIVLAIFSLIVAIRFGKRKPGSQKLLTCLNAGYLLVIVVAIISLFTKGQFYLGAKQDNLDCFTSSTAGSDGSQTCNDESGVKDIVHNVRHELFNTDESSMHVTPDEDNNNVIVMAYIFLAYQLGLAVAAFVLVSRYLAESDYVAEVMAETEEE